jgi:hypothetical protein
VTSGSDGNLWRRFEHDPRDPAYAGMRASDRDRAVVHDVLAEAYAEGRLDRDELDERTAAVDSAKTYADLLPPIRDLTADALAARFTPVAEPDLRRSAQLYYGNKLRDALFGFLVPNLICWMIWVVAGMTFPWPLFVTIPTGLNLLRVATSRGAIVEERIQKLQRRQAKALEEKTGGPAPEAGTTEDDGSAGPIVREEPRREDS